MTITETQARRNDWSKFQIKAVSMNERTIRFDLIDGRTLLAPIKWFPRLKHASWQERKNYQINPGCTGVHWPDVDEDISVRVLMGLPS